MRITEVEGVVATALRKCGIKKGDTIYLSTQLYSLGRLNDEVLKERYLKRIYDECISVIGSNGTLVVPTFTQQVGRYGLPFILEETQSLTGIFGEYLRTLNDSERSLHPIFSVAAVGPMAKSICNEISPVAFGIESVFDRIYRNNAKLVCMGFDYYSGHIVSLMHFVETMFAVPYYYNKIINSAVFSSGLQSKKKFVINVMYREFGSSFNYKKYIDKLAENACIHESHIGRGMMYCVDAKTSVDVGIEMLKDDIYVFLDGPPNFISGIKPMDGPESHGETNCINWPGNELFQK